MQSTCTCPVRAGPLEFVGLLTQQHNTKVVFCVCLRETTVEMTMTGRDETPPELWRMVVSHLPRDTARQCLFVSKMFHAFAASLLFSTIRLRFGSWQVEYGFNGIPPEEDSGCRSCCIVLRIISDPVFASYVKHLQVIAYPGHDATFEMCPFLTSRCMYVCPLILHFEQVVWGRHLAPCITCEH